jgi:hypothetical protein
MRCRISIIQEIGYNLILMSFSPQGRKERRVCIFFFLSVERTERKKQHPCGKILSIAKQFKIVNSRNPIFFSKSSMPGDGIA